LHHHCSSCPPQRFWSPRPGARTFRAPPRGHVHAARERELKAHERRCRGNFLGRRDDDDRVRCNRRGSRDERAEPVGAVQLAGICPAPDRSAHAPGCMGYVATGRIGASACGESARGYGAVWTTWPGPETDRRPAARDGRHAKCCFGRTRVFRTWRT
jgi:hypothetical protein